jgi:opacity protein-like surface antigen
LKKEVGVKRAYASFGVLVVTLGLILFIIPLSSAQESQPEEKVSGKKITLKLSSISLGAYGQVSLPLDPYLETNNNPGPGFGLGAEYKLASLAKVGVGFRYSFHKGVDRIAGTNEYHVDWRTTSESIYGKIFPGYLKELPLFALVEISFCQFHPIYHVSYLSFPYGEMEEKGKTRTRIGVGTGVGLESKISEKITLNFQTLFTVFTNKNLTFHFDSGYSAKISNETRLLILQGGVLFSPF